jgi:23S rRNA (pseudouridine1915-N3)-methyltransferase
VVAWIGRHQRSAWEDLCARYRARVSRVVPVRDLPLRSRGGDQDPHRLEKEAELLLASLPTPSRLLALDRRGQPSSSEELASLLRRWWEEWPHGVVFALGSDVGLAPRVLDRADRVLSLSPMTFSHELARLILYEQLYRVASQWTGTGYHRADGASPASRSRRRN